MPFGHGALLQQQRHATVVGVGRARLAQRLVEQRYASGVIGVAVRAGGPHQQVDVVEAVAVGQRLGLGDALPQLQRTLQQLGGVGLGVGGGRRVGGADRRPQRLGLVAGAMEVVGDRRREPRAAVSRQPRLQRACDRAVQLGALAGQQVVVDDLAQQHVAERVAVAVVDGDDVAGDRVAQRGPQRGVVEHLELLQQRVVGGLGDRRACGRPPEPTAAAARRGPSARR